MAVTITVFYGDFVKRGPACTNATFQQIRGGEKIAPLLPGVSRYVDLPISSQNGNVYVLQPITEPLNSSSIHVRIRVATDGESIPGHHKGSAEVGMDDGTAKEVWV